MSLRLTLLIAVAALTLAAAIYVASGGHFIFFALPLLFGAPRILRRRR